MSQQLTIYRKRKKWRARTVIILIIFLVAYEVETQNVTYQVLRSNALEVSLKEVGLNWGGYVDWMLVTSGKISVYEKAEAARYYLSDGTYAVLLKPRWSWVQDQLSQCCEKQIEVIGILRVQPAKGLMWIEVWGLR